MESAGDEADDRALDGAAAEACAAVEALALRRRCRIAAGAC